MEHLSSVQIKLKHAKNTTNMLNHLKLKHPFEYGDMIAAPGQEKHQKTVTPAAIQPSLAETLERKVKYKHGSSRKTLLDRDLLLLIVQANHFQLLKTKDFDNL